MTPKHVPFPSTLDAKEREEKEKQDKTQGKLFTGFVIYTLVMFTSLFSNTLTGLTTFIVMGAPYLIGAFVYVLSGFFLRHI